MHLEKISIGETNIRLKSDVGNHNLKNYIYTIRSQLKSYISTHPDFTTSLIPVDAGEDAPIIVQKMHEASVIAGTGPMAAVAGCISELSLKYLMNLDSKYSIVENGGDIALVNDKKVLCGIYSDNEIIGNSIAFEIKPRRKMLGICTSSGKIGHSISFGNSDSVSVISDSPSVGDALATRIANEVRGMSSEEKVTNGAECGEKFREFFDGVLIISDGNVATIGKLPKIVESNEFSLIL